MIKKYPEIEKVIRKGFGYIPFGDWGVDEDLVEEYSEEFKRRKKICEEVLANYDKSRDVDRILDFECLAFEFKDIKLTSDKDNVYIKIPKKIIKFLPSPETYTRCRRKFNSEQKYLPINYATIVRRSKRQKTIRQFFAQQKNDK